MKRIISLLLCIVIWISSTNIVLAKDNKEDVYTTISVEFSDNIGEIEDLQVMIKNNHVYANVEELGERLGYEIKILEEYVAVYNQRASQTIPYSLTAFYYGSTKVAHMLFYQMIESYEAPFETVKNENGIWIPLEYSLLLLNSSMLIVDNTILIDMPSKNIVDIFTDITKSKGKYDFDWQKDIGISEENQNIMGKASFIVTVFDGILSEEGEAWVQFVQSFALDSSSYDAKYGEQLAKLFCTYSNKELKEATSNLKDTMSYFNGKGKLGKTISILEEYGDERIGELLKKSEELKDKIDVNNSTSLLAYNKAYQALENACDQADFFSDATDLYMQVGEEVQKATSCLDKFYKVAEVIGFATEFKNQDEFTMLALTEFVSNSASDSVMSNVMKESIKNYINILQTDVASYSLLRYLKENYDDLIFDAADLTSALSLSARVLLLTWDIFSEVFPFYENGLEHTDSFMLFMYADILKADAFMAYESIKNFVFSDMNHINAEHLYKMSEYCYTYLKSCYITRNAALASLTDDVKKNFPNIIEYQNQINQEIASYLILLKNANTTNERGCYGFLLEDNRNYLKNYNEESLLKIVEMDFTSEIIENKSEREIIMEHMKTETGLYCKWFMQGDFDNDGREDAFVFMCTSDTDYSDGEVWYYSATNKKLLFWLNAWEGALFYKVVSLIPVDLVNKLIEMLYDIEE